MLHALVKCNVQVNFRAKVEISECEGREVNKFYELIKY